MRSPVVVVLLSIVTLGIYTLFWYYRVFEDLKLRTGNGVGGVVGLLLGLCISIVNVFLLPAEIGNMYAQEGSTRDPRGELRAGREGRCRHADNARPVRRACRRLLPNARSSRSGP